MDESHKVHYERVPMHSQRGFAIPQDVITALGRGDPEIGNAVLLDTFGVHLMAAPHRSIHLETVRDIGGGDIEKGKKVLRRFIAKVRKHHTTEDRSTKTEDGKLSKAEAGYIPHGTTAQHCAGCSMFQKPDDCTLVKGEIDSKGWCKHFEPRS